MTESGTLRDGLRTNESETPASYIEAESRWNKVLDPGLEGERIEEGSMKIETGELTVKRIRGPPVQPPLRGSELSANPHNALNRL